MGRVPSPTSVRRLMRLSLFQEGERSGTGYFPEPFVLSASLSPDGWEVGAWRPR